MLSKASRSQSATTSRCHRERLAQQTSGSLEARRESALPSWAKSIWIVRMNASLVSARVVDQQLGFRGIGVQPRDLDRERVAVEWAMQCCRDHHCEHSAPCTQAALLESVRTLLLRAPILGSAR
jgi:hypothetical protein